MNLKIYLLYFTVFFTIVGFGMVFPLLPFYAQNFGASAEEIGLLAASFSVGQFLASPFAGRISDRFGRKPVLFVAIAGTSLTFLMFGLANSLMSIFISRFLQGIFSAGAFPIASAYIGDVTTREQRIKFMSRLTGTLSLGFIVGPVFGGFLSTKDINLPFFVSSILCAVNSIFIIFFLPESLTKKAEKLVLKEGFLNIKKIAFGIKGNLKILFLMLFAWSFAISNSQVAFPLFSESEFSFTGRETGMVFALTAVVSAFIQWVILPKLVKRHGEYKTIISGLFFMSIAQFLVPYSFSVFILVLFLSFSAVGGSILRPTVNTMLSKQAKDGQGTTMGIAFSFESLGRIAGPLVAGVVIHFFGPANQYFITSIVLFLTLMVILRGYTRGVAGDVPAPEFVKNWVYKRLH